MASTGYKIDRNYLAKSQKNEGRFINCCSSSNIDDGVIDFLAKDITDSELVAKLISRYPEASYSETKNLLEGLFGKGYYFLGSGSDDLIARINLYATLTKKRVAVINPVFYRISENVNIVIEINWENIFEVSLDGVDLCWINNPNALNNSHINKKQLLNLIDKNKSTIFVIDETAILFLEDWKSQTLFSEVFKKSNIIIISSLSKYFGLPGVRFGFGATNKTLLKEIEPFLTIFPISSLSNYWAQKILSKQGIIEDVRVRLTLNKEIIKRAMEGKWGEMIDSKMNFVWCKDKSYKIYDNLLRHGILALKIRCRGENWTRLTVHGSEKINTQVVDKLLHFNLLND